jgi:hypothetical protein
MIWFNPPKLRELKELGYFLHGPNLCRVEDAAEFGFVVVAMWNWEELEACREAGVWNAWPTVSKFRVQPGVTHNVCQVLGIGPNDIWTEVEIKPGGSRG